MNSDFQAKLEALVEKMPAFPASVSSILKLTANPSCAPKELVGVIEHDPILTVKILKLVNSAYFGLAREITSVKQSIVYVGLNTIKNVAISIATIGVLPNKSPSGYSLEQFLNHTLTTAAIARVLARRNGVDSKDLGDYFVSSLLHDIGQLMMAQLLPKGFQKVQQLLESKPMQLFEAEKRVFGVDHAEVGALLAERWQLPPQLVDTIRFHHRLCDSPEVSQLMKTVFVANQLSKLMGHDQDGLSHVEPIPDTINDWIGGSLEQLLENLEGVDDEVALCRLFIDAR